MMEPIQQLMAWQEQLDNQPHAKYADINVARRLLSHAIESIETIEKLKAADRSAREEYAEICRKEWREKINSARSCVEAIRETIK